MQTVTDWSQYNKQRARPRMQITLSPEGRERLERMAKERGMSVSALIDALAQAEEAREARRKTK